MGGNPFQVLLGDLNSQAGSGFLGQVMGPQPGVISIKELLTGSMNPSLLSGLGGSGASTGYSTPSGSIPGTSITGMTTAGSSPLDAVTRNFQNNIGNIIVGTVMTTAGFRIANRVLRRPRAALNRTLKQVGLGQTVQV